MGKRVRDGNQGCKVPGCDRKHKGHGYCYGHLHQIKRNGKITRPVIGEYEVKTCSVEGCFEPFKARGYCSRHTYQFYKYGKIISAEKMKGLGGRCSVPGCERPRRSNGYCEPHNQQFTKHGKIMNEQIAERNGVSISNGYVLLLKKDNPMASKRGYVHRSHWVWEQNTGHIVTPPEVIHHRNGIKDDDRFENLEIFPTDRDHQRLRHRKKGVFGVIKGGVIS